MSSMRIQTLKSSHPYANTPYVLVFGNLCYYSASGVLIQACHKYKEMGLQSNFPRQYWY